MQSSSTDPEEIDVYACISLRENLILRANQLVRQATDVQPKHHAAVARELVTLSKDLREIGMKCVQQIITWTLKNTDVSKEEEGPPKFIWNGEDYLCKMLYDLDFIVGGLPEDLITHGNFSTSDPLFIKKDLNVDASSRRAATAATLIILDAVTRKRASDTKVRRTSFSQAAPSPNLPRKVSNVGVLKKGMSHSHVMAVARRL